MFPKSENSHICLRENVSANANRACVKVTVAVLLFSFKIKN